MYIRVHFSQQKLIEILSTKERGYWYILKKKIHNMTWIHMGMFLFKNKDQCELFINKSICRFKYICADL